MGGLALIFSFFILLIITGLLILFWQFSKKKIFGTIIKFIWLGAFVSIIFYITIGFITDKKVLAKKDYYGSYVIDRDFFPGKQADWQYENFRF